MKPRHAVVITAMVAASACGGANEATGPVAGTPPPHECATGTPQISPSADGLITQSCTDGQNLTDHFVQWHGGGQKAVDGHYAAGKRSGDWVWWHENGRIAARGAMVDGAEAGQWAWWHPNGQMETRGDYFSSMKAGLWTTWYPTGQRRAEGQFRNGVKDGTWRYWRVDGSPEKDERWMLGKMQEQVLHPEPPTPKDPPR